MSNEAKIVSLVGVIVALLLGVGIYFAVKSSSSPSGTSATPLATAATVSDAGQIVRSDAYKEGDENAKVTVVEFGDFQCPFCAAVYPDVKQIMNDFKGKGVQLIFRNFPLPQHKNAQLAATAAEAAGEQGKYWEMFDLLYTNQKEWTADPPANKTVDEAASIFEGYAQQLGLDMTKYKDAVNTRKFNAKIGRDLADADALKVGGTPTFYINGKQLSDSSQLRAAITAELAK